MDNPSDTMTARLDPLRFPLHGQRLIEASAGTGKTYTLALLYTRLILGHGADDHAFGRQLAPPEILVVTFTEAATKELRARIRERLVEAAEVFAAEADSTAAPDELLRQLRDEYPREHWPGCAQRLRRAADWMDEAMIATIHGFCQRMLTEHAFASRGLFQRELVTDQSDLIAEALNDYWRMHCYPLSPEHAFCLREVAASPEALQEQLGNWLKQTSSPLSHAGQPVQCNDLSNALENACQQRAREQAAAALEEDARGAWNSQRAQLEEILLELRPHLNGTYHDSANPEKFQALLNQLGDWSDGAEEPTKLKNFAQGAFQFRSKAAVQTEPKHPAFQAIAHWKTEVARVTDPAARPNPPLAACLLAHAAEWLSRELPRRLGERAEMGFDDLLRNLEAALNPSDPNPAVQAQAQALAATLRKQFPVALIDEFQDTDPLQYRIFERIYAPQDVGRNARAVPPNRLAHPPSETTCPAPERTAWIMIGDPKQAIYSFRGADIHAYLAARQACSGRIYSLDRNFRSTQAMVEACNHLFSHADEHPRGAFRFRDESGGDNPIPFVSVSARGRSEQLVLNGKPAAAMTLWWQAGDDEPVGMVDYRRSMAQAAASEIVRWLTPGQSPQDPRPSGFRDGEQLRPLKPSDIAILVRTGKEAAAMREALAARQINSVYLSDRNSVLATSEAADILHWLRACAAPQDERLVRTALATNTLALPLAQFAVWQQNELEWEVQLERLRGYQTIWQRQGVLAMLRRLMHDAKLPARLLAQPGGERSLTNLLHLAEWLQQESTALDGEQALIRHLREHLGQSSDELMVRLESDAELVQVVTIHKSKGLEYPLVLLPFICSWRTVTGKDRQVTYRPAAASGELSRYLEIAGKDNFKIAWDQADDARLSEDMRLLYVAVTRARHALWLGVAPLRENNAKSPQLDRGAFGYALGGGKSFANSDAVCQSLEALREHCQHIAVVDLPEPRADLLPAQLGEARESARQARHRAFESWWIASYSALRLGMPAAGAALSIKPDPETARADTALEEASVVGSEPLAVVESEPAAAAPEIGSMVSVHDFPSGSRYGTFLHGLFEWAGSQHTRDPSNSSRLRGFGAAAHSQTLRRDMLARRCALHGLGAWIDPLTRWLGEMLTRPWKLSESQTLVLADLTPAQVQVEMEFWVETHQVDTQDLDALVTRHCLPGYVRPGLSTNRLNGMLKGFIDLVFEHQGRYFVLDWKSNRLGSGDADYSLETMRAAVLQHRYDLQYVLYLLALHRLLRSRLPDYDYHRHIGGAVYVFLRGGNSSTQGLFTDRPPFELIEALDQLFTGTSVPASTLASTPASIKAAEAVA